MLALAADLTGARPAEILSWSRPERALAAFLQARIYQEIHGDGSGGRADGGPPGPGGGGARGPGGGPRQ